MDKVVQAELSSLTALQEVKVKLLKHKTTQQEIISHKKIIDGR